MFKTLLEFYKKESDDPPTRVIIMTTISGLASGALLATANHAVDLSQKGSSDSTIRIFILFAIALLLFIYSKRDSMIKSNAEVERIVCKIRIRITEKITKAELPQLEKLGKATIFTALSNQTQTISQSGTVMVNSCQSAMLLIACFFYICWISAMAAIIILGAVFIGALAFTTHRAEVLKEYLSALDKERDFFAVLDSILKGFKEVKVFKKREEDIYIHAEKIAKQVEEKKISISNKLTNDYMFSQVFFYSLIGVIVFVLPIFNPIKPEMLLKLTASLLFIIGPLDSLVGSTPVFSRTCAAIENLAALEKSLEDFSNTSLSKRKPKIKSFIPFQSISFDKVLFRYKDAGGNTLFTIGPINLFINQGEILFIIGGNGSGKTSLLMLLTGLYPPEEGTLFLDEKKISLPDYPNYRELFSIIFWDFHLFDRLYGLKELDENHVDTLLKQMELDDKTQYEDGMFSSVDLSTGQKKRLALIVALLEDKEIIILDEWSADQDPQFRKYFFEVIIKDLQKKGKTVFAISHDDRYFHLADRVIKMEDGQVLENNVTL